MNGRRTGWVLFAIALLILGAMASQNRVLAETRGKGSESDESVPEIEGALSEDTPVAGKSGDADTESLEDLEKVIQSEDSKPTAKSESPSTTEPDDLLIDEVKPQPPAVASPRSAASEPTQEAPPLVPPIDASSETSREAVVTPVYSSQLNQITNLEFKMDGSNSRIVIKSRTALRYREIKNASMKQVVYYFDNAETPDRLQRAYDTTEFVSPVSLFTLLQMPGEKPPLSKLIVQLREDKEPRAVPSERGLTIEFGAPSTTKSDPQIAIGNGDISTGLPEENLSADNKVFSGKPIRRLEIKNSDIQDVLRLIAQSSGYNIVVGDDVTGKVGTLSLDNVPWDQAFALVMQSKKLGYVRNGNVLRVATLANLKTEKEEQFQTEQAKIRVEPLRTALIPVSYAKAAELAPRAKSFLTDRGTIDTDVRTNTVIVKDIEKVVNRVQKLYAALDSQPPRVAISAKIIEIQNKYSRDLGMSALGFGSNLSGLNLSQSMSLTVGGLAATNISAPQFASLNARFEMGEAESKVKTLANPQVSVVANQKASVTQSFTFFVNETTFAGGVPTITKKQVVTALTLDVTPIVSGDGSIFLDVDVKNDIPNTVEGTIDSRNVKTQILLENGDTAVVGGVFQNTVSNAVSGLPLLSRIPVLGYLFSSNRESDSRNEVFMFLTARITNAEESFKRSF